MDLKAIIAVFFYYFILACVFNFGIVYLNGASMTGTTPVNVTYNDTGGTSTSGISGFFTSLGDAISRIGQTAAFMFFGVGLPSDTPALFQYILSGIFSLITIIAVVVVVNSFWSGGK